MLLGPNFRRELITSSRRRSTYVDRAASALVVLGVILACVLTWDYLGLDRASMAGMAWFSRVTFGAVVAVLAAILMAVVPTEVAPGVAGERDKKTLDALLATPLTAAEIVTGAMAAGLVRSVSGMSVGLSVAALAVPFLGIDPRLVVLAFAGLAATAFALAALSALVSVGAKSAHAAVNWAVLLAWFFWLGAPMLAIGPLPRLWPALGRWVYPFAIVLLDSSPVGVVANVAGIARRSGLVEAVVWMIGYELFGGGLLVAWAVWRLRPASRALYDGEGRSALRALRRTRWRNPPPCGDDPVLWREMHDTHGVRAWQFFLGMAIHLALFVGLVVVTYHFARPAFLEVVAFGYRAAPVEKATLEINPVVRAIVTAFGPAQALGPLPSGQARHEFNVVLRLATLFYYMMHVLVVANFASESLTMEKERDTWSGLIATPLSGREVLRAKMLGTVWRMRYTTATLVGLWFVGLAAGAVHPLGFLASVLGLVVSGWFLLALGTWLALWSVDRKQATNRVVIPTMLMALSGFLIVIVPRGSASVLFGVGSMPVIGGLSLLSYEDVRASTVSAAFPYLAEINVTTGEGALAVAATCLMSLTAQTVLALLLTRAAFRGFDAAVGRPVRRRVKTVRRSGPVAVSGRNEPKLA